jgi:hypothetical protein
MKNIFKIVALAACLFTSPAFAQFSQDAVVGSSGGGTPGGTSGQQQYNNSGSFGGFTQSGNCTTVTSTGVTSCDFPTSGYASTLWFLPYTGYFINGLTSASPVASTIYCYYGAVAQKATIGNLGFSVATLAASGNVQLAIYTNSSGRPGALLSSTASQTTAATGSFALALAANKQVGPGGADAGRDVWWCMNADASAGGTVKFIGIGSGGSTGAATLSGSTTLANVVNRFAQNIFAYSCAAAACTGGSSTFGTWPASLAGSTWSDVTSLIQPLIAFQPASVP